MLLTCITPPSNTESDCTSSSVLESRIKMAPSSAAPQITSEPSGEYSIDAIVGISSAPVIAGQTNTECERAHRTALRAVENTTEGRMRFDHRLAREDRAAAAGQVGEAERERAGME